MKLDWRRGILYITTIGMECCWLYALLALLNKQTADGRLSVLAILALYPVAFIFNAWLGRLRWPRAGILGMSWLGWAVGMLLLVKFQLFGDLPVLDWQWFLSIPRSIAGVIHTFKPELLILLSTGILWWLGWRLATRMRNFPAMVGEFQFGLTMLIPTFLVASLLKTSLDNPVPVALTFFLLALLGISVAHALEGTSWLSGLYQRHWVGLLLVTFSVIIILGLLVTSVVTPDLLQALWAGIKWLGGTLWSLITKVMDFIVNIIPQPEPVELPFVTSTPTMEPTADRLLPMSDSWLNSFRIGWAVLVGGVLFFLLWQICSHIFGWLRRKLASMAGAEFEPLPGAFKADFLSFLKHLFARLRKLRLPFRLRRKETAFLPEVASVRQIYRQLLRWAAAGGYPRQISQTPNEYCYTLVGLLPEAREDLDLVTQQYIRARYGAWLSTGDEINALKQAWYRVKETRLKRATTELAHRKEESSDEQSSLRKQPRSITHQAGSR
jgi:hypothetical protein